mmetsp:Transcript_7902/g.25913  ORF Transcript_7902/g.25913 Transcript_7902/m.25913 type:complete len:305 (-) Transcript_7902:1344-2258(-)
MWCHDSTPDGKFLVIPSRPTSAGHSREGHQSDDASRPRSSIIICASAPAAAPATSAEVTAAAAPRLATPAAPALGTATPARRRVLLALRHGDSSPEQFGPIDRRDRRQSVIHFLHVDKGKTARPAVVVGHHADPHNSTERGKQIAQIVLGGAKRNVADVGTERRFELSRLAGGETLLHLLRIFHEMHVVGKRREAQDGLEPLMIAVRAAHPTTGAGSHGVWLDSIRCLAVGTCDHAKLLTGGIRLRERLATCGTADRHLLRMERSHWTQQARDRRQREGQQGQPLPARGASDTHADRVAVQFSF